MDVDQLWRDYKQNPTLAVRNRLVEIYLPIVEHAAGRLHSTLPDSIDIHDLISAGVFGLIGAIEAFDLKRNLRFENYAPRRIRGAMLDELRAMDFVPRLTRRREAAIKKLLEALERVLGRRAENGEAAYVLGCDDEDFEKIARENEPVTQLSLSRKWFEKDNFKEVCEIDILEDARAEHPQARLDRGDDLRRLTRGLNRKERLLVLLYYWEGDSMAAIGRVLGLTESRVSQMHTEIMRRQKERLTSPSP